MEEDILLKKLNDLKDATQNGDLDTMKTIIHSFHDNLSSNKDLLAKLYRSGYKGVTQTDLIIAAYSCQKTDVLHYLLNGTDILDYLTDASFDVKQVDMQRAAALRNAICSKDFSMVEMLYDYWCGDTHDINTIKRLRCLLKNARTASEYYLIRNQQLLVNVHCLLKFNSYQHTLYTELNKLKPKNNCNNDAEAMGTMLLSVLNIYDRYSDLDVVRLPKSLKEDELYIKALLKDKTTVYTRGLAYLMYEIYFRKLDFSVALIILENLNDLRRHLKERFNKKKEILNNNPKYYTLYTHAAQLYGEIECTLYHYIYRTTEDWRLYLPAKRPLTLLKNNRIGFHNGQIISLDTKYDSHKLDKWPVLFYEQRNFKKCLNKLKNILEKHVISKDPLANTVSQNQSGVQLKKNRSPVEIFIDDNYLKQMEYVRDYYSLVKIVYYIEAVENASDINVLMIERALQVIGEMLKSTDASYHLSPTTKSLLQTAVSVETIVHLHNIRKYLSKVDKGQLNRRIDIDIADSQVKQVFDNIKKDLEKIKQNCNPIIHICRCILDKSLLEKGLGLLDERIKELPDEAQQRKDEIYNLFKMQREKLFMKSNKFMKELSKTDLTTQLVQEIPWILENRDFLLNKKHVASICTSSLAVNIFPKYIQNIKRTLELITENNNNVVQIKTQFGQYNEIEKMPDYPEQTHISNLKKKFKNIDAELLRMVNQLIDYSIHWESIKNLLKFFLEDLECEVFATLNFEFVTKDSLPDMQTVNKIHQLLAEMETICLTQESAPYPGLYQNHSFHGIEELDKNIYTESNNNDTERTKRNELILCLTKRVDLLKNTLEYSKQIPLSQHLLRYKHDLEFRLALEILLADIANILAHCNIRLMLKSDKLLTGVDLGNLLDHGNPFVDVICDIFNPHDFAREFLSKAMMFAEDGESIAALHELFKDNIDPKIIRLDNRNAINDNQQLFDKFKMSARWESYLDLILLDAQK